MLIDLIIRLRHRYLACSKLLLGVTRTKTCDHLICPRTTSNTPKPRKFSPRYEQLLNTVCTTGAAYRATQAVRVHSPSPSQRRSWILTWIVAWIAWITIFDCTTTFTKKGPVSPRVKLFFLSKLRIMNASVPTFSTIGHLLQIEVLKGFSYPSLNHVITPHWRTECFSYEVEVNHQGQISTLFPCQVLQVPHNCRTYRSNWCYVNSL